MLRIGRLFVIILLAGIGILGLAFDVQANSPTIVVLRVKGTVNPVLSDYVHRGIQYAEDTKAIACIIQLDTPGGLDSAMRDIIQDILDSRVPVIVYVSPSGGRAASAGAFITISAHIAAMAPDTAIGAAHPVAMSDTGEVSQVNDKIVNDAAAYIRSLATNRDRNADWAERAVRESISATEQEAREMKVIDLVASNINDLIRQLDGQQVTLLDGSVVSLQTAGTAVKYLDMDVGESFLYAIANPNIAYILLSLATLGLLVEISSPGLIFPGIVGGICLLLAFYALGMLPVNWAGVLLIVLAFGLFIAEVLTAGFGALASGGIISLVLGSLILFKGGPLFNVSPWLIAVVVIVVTTFFVFALRAVIKAHRRQASTGREEFVGKTALVKGALKPEGFVLFAGELWAAKSEGGTIAEGEEVTIKRVAGLKLIVSKIEGGH